MSDKLNTFSSAIRLGCRFGKKQGFRLWSNDVQSCAVGAGLDALGLQWTFSDSPFIRAQLVKRWPKLARDQKCPECGYELLDVLSCMSGGLSLAIHLNDKHRWSREAIADHLEGLGL